MNGTERILATLAGEPTDRRAVAPVLSLYGARLTGAPLERYYTDPEAYARGQAAVYETFRPDVLFGPFAFASIGAAFGSEPRYFADHPPNIRRPAIRSAAEWETLNPPDPDTHPRLLYFRDAVRRMAAGHREQVPVAACLPAPTDLPALVMGLEAWMDTVLFDPDGARRVMEKVIPFFSRLADAMFADGAAFVVLPWAFASPSVVTREIVTAFARPAMREALSRIKGPVVLHHVGAPLLPHLDLISGLPSVAAYALDERDDLGRARRAVGPEPVLFGGPGGPRLSTLSPGEVLSACREILEDRRPDRRFVLCTAGPDVPWDTPPENIHAMRKAAESFAGIAA